MTNQCPVDHSPLSARRTTVTATIGNAPITKAADGTWHIRSYALTKTILRSKHTTQAGFGSELLSELPDAFMKNEPVLFQDGPAHQKQRRQIAKFFTPKAASSMHRRTMERYAHEMIAELYQHGHLELGDLTMKMAVAVAAQIVGLTNSIAPGMPRRIDNFVRKVDISDKSHLSKLKQLSDHMRTQFLMSQFYIFDVKPAIIARKRKPREDVISHLIAQGYGDLEIMIECVTYGTAGMVTTREFILAAAWHFLENPALKQQYIASDEKTRHQILEEILRVEPVISHLYRRTTAPIEVEIDGEMTTIPEGTLLDLHIYAANSDEAVVGNHPHCVQALRQLAPRVKPPVMAFGDGHHRCPGAFVAMQESDIFLHKLLQIPDIRLESKPEVSFVETVKGYEITNLIVALD